MSSLIFHNSCRRNKQDDNKNKSDDGMEGGDDEGEDSFSNEIFLGDSMSAEHQSKVQSILENL